MGNSKIDMNILAKRVELFGNESKGTHFGRT